jgi:quercetin dioxygenase-like cupin family protein
VSAFDHVETIGPQPLWAGLVSRAVHGEQLTLALIELEPGATVAEHSHANEQAGIMIEGAVSFRVGEETGELRAGSTWVIPAHVPHAVVAGPAGAVLVEAFAPPRGDWGALETLPPGPGRWRP